MIISYRNEDSLHKMKEIEPVYKKHLIDLSHEFDCIVC